MTIILDNIRSAFNVGSVMRSCDAVGAKLITIGYTPQPLGETRLLIKKTAISAEDYVEFEHYDHCNQVFETYPNKLHLGVELYDDAVNIYDFLEDVPFDLDNVFLWVGNEINGLSIEQKDKFDHIIFLPMMGKKESLNVSNTVTTVAYLLKLTENKKIVKK